MKKLFLPAMLLVAAISSCAKNEPDSVSNSSSLSNSDLVGLNVYSGSSKALDATTETLEDSEYVTLHIDDSSDVNQTLEFYFDGTEWSQTASDAIKWSAISFPANFYSLHDGEDFTSLTFNTGSATYSDYTVTGKSTEHKDLVYHASKLTTIPSGGAVSAYHKHALSKLHLYASTGTNIVYIARVTLVEFDAMGTVTITPLSADQISTADGVSWVNSESTYEDYQYYYVGTGTIQDLSSADGDDPIINEDDDAPLMIIPQETTAATMIGTASSVAIFKDSYIEVIYYLTDSEDMPIVGYSSVAARPDKDEYITADQTKTLYVMGAFPIAYEFAANKEYDIALGLGSDGSTGGLLVADYYVDKDGDAVSLTKVGATDPESPIDIPEIEEGDEILGDSSDDICIVVTAHSWDDSEDAVNIN